VAALASDDYSRGTEGPIVNIEHELKEIKRISEANLRQSNEIFTVVSRIERKLNQLLHHNNDALVLTIPNQQGETTMGAPATLVLGQPPVQATVQESLGGVNEPNTGPIAYASDNPAVASVDPVAGLVTSVSAGTCNISATDSTNVPALSDSVAVTVVASGPPPPQQNDTLVLSIPSQTQSARGVQYPSKRTRF
jgi:hypothetical protein